MSELLRRAGAPDRSGGGHAGSAVTASRSLDHRVWSRRCSRLGLGAVLRDWGLSPRRSPPLEVRSRCITIGRGAVPRLDGAVTAPPPPGCRSMAFAWPWLLLRTADAVACPRYAVAYLRAVTAAPIEGPVWPKRLRRGGGGGGGGKFFYLFAGANRVARNVGASARWHGSRWAPSVRRGDGQRAPQSSVR
jgi:hypothetical protein